MPNFLINVKEKGAKKASKNIGGLNTALGGLASKAALAAGAFFGGGMLLSGMRNAITLAGEQEKAEKTLEVALGRRSQSLLDQATALQQVTTFGDEAIISAQALIGAFVRDEEQIKLATAATLDLAAAKGMDLTVAADLVSKTLGSSTNAMSRYGIQVTGAVGSTERLESLTNNLANVFGGQASAQAETMSGKLEQMKNAAGDTAEAIGDLLSNAVIPIAEKFKSASESATSFIKSLKDVNENEEQLTLTSERNAKVLQTLGGIFGFVSEKFTDLGLSSGHFRNIQKEILDNAVSTESAFAEQEAAMQPVIESEIRRTNETTNYLGELKKVSPVLASASLEREKLTKKELSSYALTTGKASDAMKSVVKAESMEAIAGFIASIFKTVPFPLNAVLAAGAGATVSNLIDQGLSKIPNFATGGDFVTNGEQLIRVGDNPSGRERVQITPLGGDPAPNAPSGASVVVNVSGNVMSQDYVEGELAEQIKEAIRKGNDFGVS
tara:strand:- start:348 stop:1838 length:1491 start_codon:yes stop_codon:yes gene_type:complete